MKMNGIKHIRSSPYHLSSNGAAERLIWTFKIAVKAGVGRTTPLSQRLASFLMTYRTTPHATTQESPSEVLMGRKITTRLDLLKPCCYKRVSDKQAQQKADHDKHAHAQELRPGHHECQAWLWRSLVPFSYLIQMDDGKLWTRHMDHLRFLRDTPVPLEQTQAPEDDWSFSTATEPSPHVSKSAEIAMERTPLTVESSSQNRHFPEREQRPPDRFE